MRHATRRFFLISLHASLAIACALLASPVHAESTTDTYEPPEVWWSLGLNSDVIESPPPGNFIVWADLNASTADIIADARAIDFVSASVRGEGGFEHPGSLEIMSFPDALDASAYDLGSSAGTGLRWLPESPLPPGEYDVEVFFGNEEMARANSTYRRYDNTSWRFTLIVAADDEPPVSALDDIITADLTVTPEQLLIECPEGQHVCSVEACTTRWYEFDESTLMYQLTLRSSATFADSFDTQFSFLRISGFDRNSEFPRASTFWQGALPAGAYLDQFSFYITGEEDYCVQVELWNLLTDPTVPVFAEQLCRSPDDAAPLDPEGFPSSSYSLDSCQDIPQPTPPPSGSDTDPGSECADSITLDEYNACDVWIRDRGNEPDDCACDALGRSPRFPTWPALGAALMIFFALTRRRRVS